MRDLYSSGRKHATSVNAEAKKIGIMAVVMTLAVLSALASVGEACIGERARQAQDSRRYSRRGGCGQPELGFGGVPAG